MARITLKDILAAIDSQGSNTNRRLDAIEAHLKTLNGKMVDHDKCITRLQDHETERAQDDGKRDAKLSALEAKQQNMEVNQAKASGIWGAIGGAIPALLQYLLTR